MTTNQCPLARALAESLRAEREGLVMRWLERIASHVDIAPNQVFPSAELLDHVPLLIDGIACYLEDPADEISADAPVIAKAMELGELRYSQGFDAYQILMEYEILGGVLFQFLVRTVDAIQEPCTRGELLTCAHRLFRSISVIQQHTTTHFLRLADERVAERETRMRSFNLAVSHELRNRIGAVNGAAEMLAEDWILADKEQARKFSGIIMRNASAMQESLQSLIELSRMDPGATHGRNVVLPDALAEAVRKLREFAQSRGVRVQVNEDLPRLEVPASLVDLVLTNLISNAVKYRDPEEDEPWVRIEGRVHASEDGSRAVIVEVSDNGMGVPPDARASLFRRFFRAHEAVTQEAGSGVGLSLVREAVESVGGRVWADFPGKGSVFTFLLPLGIRIRD